MYFTIYIYIDIDIDIDISSADICHSNLPNLSARGPTRNAPSNAPTNRDMLISVHNQLTNALSSVISEP